MRIALVLFLLPLATIALAQEPQSSDQERQARLTFLKTKAALFELSADEAKDKPFKLHDEPLLRYTNPIRTAASDGVTFIWLDGKRPVAAASWAIRPEEKVWREFSSLTGKPLSCVVNARVIWSPRTGGLVDQPFASPETPQDTASRRLVQMRSLSRKFKVEMKSAEEVTELRLLTQPIYRYEDAQSGILDGALFSFSEVTDPETLLLLEARSASGSKDYAWRFTLARMTSRSVRVLLDGKEIWSVAGYWKEPRSQSDPYIEGQQGIYTPAEQPTEKDAATPR